MHSQGAAVCGDCLKGIKKGGASPVLSLIARCVLEECLRTFSICSVHGQPIWRQEGGYGHLRVLDVIADACDDPRSADVLHPSAHSWNGVVRTIVAVKSTFLTRN